MDRLMGYSSDQDDSSTPGHTWDAGDELPTPDPDSAPHFDPAFTFAPTTTNQPSDGPVTLSDPGDPLSTPPPSAPESEPDPVPVLDLSLQSEEHGCVSDPLAASGPDTVEPEFQTILLVSLRGDVNALTVPRLRKVNNKLAPCGASPLPSSSSPRSTTIPVIHPTSPTSAALAVQEAGRSQPVTIDRARPGLVRSTTALPHPEAESGFSFSARCSPSGWSSSIPSLSSSPSPSSSFSHSPTMSTVPNRSPLPAGSPPIRSATAGWVRERAMLDSSSHHHARLNRKAHVQRVCLMARFGLLDQPSRPPLPGQDPTLVHPHSSASTRLDPSA